MYPKKHILKTDDLIVRIDVLKKHGTYFSEVSCPRCRKIRLVKNSYICQQRSIGKYTGMCTSCCAMIRNRDWPVHPRWKGRYSSGDGYVFLNIKLLETDPHYHLALPMCHKKRNSKFARIYEHRWIMAKHLNRPLLPSEVVHHRNGIRSDNRLENLELLTTNLHTKGHGDIYYQKWMEAEKRIVDLEKQLEERC